MTGVVRRLQAGVLVLALALGVLLPAPAQAAGIFENGCEDIPDSKVCQSSTTDTAEQAQSMTGTIINIILFIVGILSVLMIIIGGIRYVTSNGESSQIQSAKNTIMYAVVGLVVTLIAFPLVGFVLSNFK